jgi:hypothetical protein
VAVASSEATTIDNAIVIFSTDSDPAVMEFRYPTPEEYALYSFAGWDGEDRIKLSIYARIGDQSKDVDAAVTRTGAGWILDKPNGVP